MGNKPLITESKLSWIRDTTSDAAPDKPETPPETKGGKTAKEQSSREHFSNPTSETAKQASHKAVPPETHRRVEPPHATRRAPEYAGRIESPRVARPLFDQDPVSEPGYRSEPRYGDQQSMRQEMYYTGQWPPQAPPEPANYPRARRPGILHYVLAFVALACVAFAPIPERISNLIFLGFIFVMLLEISYRLGQRYRQDKLNSEYLQRILFYLRQDERGDRQGPR